MSDIKTRPGPPATAYLLPPPPYFFFNSVFVLLPSFGNARNEPRRGQIRPVMRGVRVVSFIYRIVPSCTGFVFIFWDSLGFSVSFVFLLLNFVLPFTGISGNSPKEPRRAARVVGMVSLNLLGFSQCFMTFAHILQYSMSIQLVFADTLYRHSRLHFPILFSTFCWKSFHSCLPSFFQPVFTGILPNARPFECRHFFPKSRLAVFSFSFFFVRARFFYRVFFRRGGQIRGVMRGVRVVRLLLTAGPQRARSPQLNWHFRIVETGKKMPRNKTKKGPR